MHSIRTAFLDLPKGTDLLNASAEHGCQARVIVPGSFSGGEIEPGTFHNTPNPPQKLSRHSTWVDDSPDVNPAL